MNASTRFRGKEGQMFGLASFDFLQAQTHTTDPLQVIREAVQNSLEAKASAVSIWFDAEGILRIGDDGGGMTPKELEQFTKDFGASSKPRGRTKNFGVGLKMAAMMSGIRSISVISRRKGSEAAFHRVAIGQQSEGSWGPFKLGASSLSEEVTRTPFKGQFNTIVEIEGLVQGIDDVSRYLTRRYFDLSKCPVRVLQDGELNRNPTWRNVDGLEKLLLTYPNNGKVDLEHCTLYWGQTPEIGFKCPKHLPEVCFALGTQGEIFKTYGPNASHHLSKWGIVAGNRQVILIVDAKGADITPNPTRSAFTGWDEDQAQEEVIQNLPKGLTDFMEVFQAAHWAQSPERDQVMQRLEEYRLRLSLPPSESEETQPSGGGHGGSNGTAEPSGKTRTRSSGPRRVRTGLPDYAFVDEAELGTQVAAYRPLDHKILINEDSERFLEAINLGANVEARTWGRAQVAFAVIVGWATQKLQYEDDPPLVALESAFNTACAALYTTLSTSPRPTQRSRRASRRK